VPTSLEQIPIERRATTTFAMPMKCQPAGAVVLVGGGQDFVPRQGIFFSIISLIFFRESGDISQNFFAWTKFCSRLWRSSSMDLSTSAFISPKSVLSCRGSLFVRRRRRKLRSRAQYKIETGAWGHGFRGSGGPPAPRQAIFWEISLS